MSRPDSPIARTETLPEISDGHSTIFEKLDPHRRRKLDRAIIDRSPPTYRAVFDHFRLGDSGVSFTAFYYYARRLRARAAVINLAELALPEESDLSQAVPRLIMHQLIESLLSTEHSPRNIEHISRAWRTAACTPADIKLREEAARAAADRELARHNRSELRQLAESCRHLIKLGKLHPALRPAQPGAPAPGQPAAEDTSAQTE